MSALVGSPACAKRACDAAHAVAAEAAERVERLSRGGARLQDARVQAAIIHADGAMAAFRAAIANLRASVDAMTTAPRDCDGCAICKPVVQ